MTDKPLPATEKLLNNLSVLTSVLILTALLCAAPVVYRVWAWALGS